jgi:hypothetical protein
MAPDLNGIGSGFLKEPGYGPAVLNGETFAIVNAGNLADFDSVHDH